MERVKKAFSKSAFITAVCFSLSIFVISVCFSLAGLTLYPIMVTETGICFLILGVITFVRLYVDGNRWFLNKPFILKSLIFMPFYLISVLVLDYFLVKELNGIYKLWLMIMYAVLFFVVFSIVQVIRYFILKVKTDAINDALNEFQKEHGWDEKE